MNEEISNDCLPGVTVCMPVYNGMPYLAAAVLSVLEQDYKNLEIVISLDPSSDDSELYLDGLSDSRIRIVKNVNPGLFQNLNNSIHHSSMDLIQIFCQDDVMLSGYLSSQVNAFLAYPEIAVVLAKCKKIDSKGNTLTQTVNSNEFGPLPRRQVMWRQAHYASIADSISCIMLSKSRLDYDFLFDESYSVAGDVEFYNRVALTKTLAYNKDELFQNRAHSGQASRNISSVAKYISEEGRIYNEHWKNILSIEQSYAVMSYRAKTRGVLHLKSLVRALWRTAPITSIKTFALLHTVYGIDRVVPGLLKNYFRESPFLLEEDFDIKKRNFRRVM